MAPMACRSACKEKNHTSLGECIRDSGIRIGQVDATKQKAWDAELGLYRSAREQGLQPATTRTKDVRFALDESDRTGQPYGAGV